MRGDAGDKLRPQWRDQCKKKQNTTKKPQPNQLDMEGCPDSPGLPGVPQGRGAGPESSPGGMRTLGAALDVLTESEWGRPVGVFCPSIRAGSLPGHTTWAWPPSRSHQPGHWAVFLFLFIKPTLSLERGLFSLGKGMPAHTACSEKHKQAPGGANCVVSTSGSQDGGAPSGAGRGGRV